MTLVQTVERLRNNGSLPTTGPVCIRELNDRFRPDSCSVRALMSKMLEGLPVKLPWAIILCRFKGEAPNPAMEVPTEKFFREIFTAGTGGLVEYWRDASLAAIEITGSQVSQWIELSIFRSQAGGIGRTAMVNLAIQAAKSRGFNPVDGFHSQIAIVTHNWSNDDPQRPPGTPTWQNDDPLKPWWPTWIDGSSDGKIVCLTPPYDGDITAHEMGHVFGMNHDVDSDLQTDYKDPCCIMSQNGSFVQPRWQVNFGPAICLPHLMQQGWMYNRRVFVDNGDWMSQPDGIILPIAPITCPGAHANLGIKLAYKRGDNSWDYYLEYVIATEWNQGLPGAPYLFIRRMSPKYGGTPAYLGAIPVPSAIGKVAEWIEPSGNVRFQVEKTGLPGPILKAGAKML